MAGDLPRTYVASPHGFTEAGRTYYRETLLPRLEAVVDVVDPWSLTPAEEIAELEAAGRFAELNRRIGARNEEAIRSCDQLVAVLDGQEPDAGTCAEVGFAAALGLRIEALRSDWREAGERGALVNLQVEHFVRASGGDVVDRLDALVARLRAPTLG